MMAFVYLVENTGVTALLQRIFSTANAKILETGLSIRTFKKTKNRSSKLGGFFLILNRTKFLRLIVENTGVEPVTSCLPGKRSSQLS